MNPFVGKKVLFLDIHNNEREGTIVAHDPYIESKALDSKCYLVVPTEVETIQDDRINYCVRGNNYDMQYISNLKNYLNKKYLMLRFSELLEIWGE